MNRLLEFLRDPVWQAIAAIIAVVVLGVAVMGKLFPITPSLSLSDRVVTQEREISALKSQIEVLNQKLDRLDSDIASLPQKTDQSEVSLQVSRIDASLSEVISKIANLEQVILEDPNKAVSLLLLRKDLDNMNAVYESRILSLEQSIDRLHSLIIGILAVIGIGFLSIAASSFAAKRKPEGEE